MDVQRQKTLKRGSQKLRNLSLQDKTIERELRVLDCELDSTIPYKVTNQEVFLISSS